MSRPVRRSQAVSPFGVGALVDFPKAVSLVHAGLDAWPFDPANPAHAEFKVDDEPRLARMLGVDFFVQPPDFRKVSSGSGMVTPNAGLKLPFLRFPIWHSCPRCGRMFETHYHDPVPPRCNGPVGSGAGKGQSHPARTPVQVRFVAVCKQGHMRDFPWLEWLDLDRDEWGGHRSNRWLRLISTGSASTTGVVVAAEEMQSSGIVTVKRRSLAGAFGIDTGIQCDGQNPSLSYGDGGDEPVEQCGERLKAVLRGASNLYFADVRSAIYVPTIQDHALPQGVLDLLDDYAFKQKLIAAALGSQDGTLTPGSAAAQLEQDVPESTVDPETLAEAFNKHALHEVLTSRSKVATALVLASQTTEGALTAELVREVIANSGAIKYWKVDPRRLVTPLKVWLQTRSGSPAEGEDTDTGSSGRVRFRHEEYAAFCRDGQEGSPKVHLLVRSRSVAEYDALIGRYFSRVSLLEKLRETRAFVGYSRVEASPVTDPASRWRLVSRKPLNWLPAVVVRGEGFFLVFDEERLDRWDQRYGAFHRERLGDANRSLAEQARRRGTQHEDVSPKFILLHTFAHGLINQLTFECGYGSSSLRERIYFSDASPRMAGILIYTAAGDSEGTMGGLVKMGQPGHLERTVAKAIDRMRWCSSDPVCIESKGQGPGSCNLGACHSCALLPETSCEQQNRLLDRAMLIGTLGHPDAGYFSGRSD